MTAATTTRERPSIFSGPMVKAILEDKKTQTRRVVNLKTLAVTVRRGIKSDIPGDPVVALPGRRYHAEMNPQGAVSVLVGSKWLGLKPGEFDFVCPYANARTDLVAGKWALKPEESQRLWVRETLQRGVKKLDTDGVGCYSIQYKESCTPVPYAVGAAQGYCGYAIWQWKRNTLPAIHMPRWASRITLEVIGVRMERLQDISTADVAAEGVTLAMAEAHGEKGKNGAYPGYWATAFYKAFAVLWDGINGKRAPWTSNPFVWVISFRRVDQ